MELVMVSLFNPCYAHIPFQILQTCMKNKPYDENITIEEIGDEGAADNPMNGCDDHYEFIYDKHAYGTLFY